jgi:hypothetical protein
MTNPYLTQLSSFISEHGIDAADAHLQQLAGMARRRGVATTAAKVMTDRASPRIVRERAFAMVCSALTAAGPAQTSFNSRNASYTAA